MFNIHRSNYKYWAKQGRRIKPEEVKALAMIKSIHAESNSSVGARTISELSPQEVWRLAVMLLRI